MIRTILLLLLLSPLGPVAAQARVLTVQSGGHAGFSRLVLSPGPEAVWSFGRTEEGYELRIEPDGTVFDVSRVYDLIGRDRLAAIRTDPVTGALQLRVGCACHAIPYTLGDGVLVIDLRDGPAPTGSSFERSVGGPMMPPLADPAQRRPKPRPAATAYDWLADHYRGLGARPASLASPRPAGDDGLRRGLLRQLAEGASRGAVTMRLLPSAATQDGAAAIPQIRVGEDLGLVVLPGGALDDPRAKLTAEGMDCVPDASLDLDAWLVHPEPAAGLAAVRSRLVGEFDAPDPAAVSTAVRYMIAIGFGAEARQLIGSFAGLPARIGSDEALLLTALTYGVDGDAAPMPRFGTMASCDTAAALWAAVETTGGPLPADLNDDAVIRAFSALPPGLRRHLGGDLTARLLAAGRPDTARALTDAMQRLPGVDDATRLGAARVGLAMGGTVAADDDLQAIAGRNGPVAADALVELAESRARGGDSMTRAQADALAALAQEYRGTDREPGLRRAVVLALALADDFDGAFGKAPPASVMPDLWRLLAARGSDAAVLAHAVLSDPAAALAAAPEDRRRIAERLAALGLPDAALPWLPPASDDADRRLAATAHLARRDGLSALRIVDGMPGPEADVIRGLAEAALGAPDRAADAFARAGDAAAAARQARLAADWLAVAKDEDTVWAAAAGLAAGPPPGAGPLGGTAPAAGDPGIAAALVGSGEAEPASVAGPLARGAALVADATAARAAIDALLAATVPPDAGTPAGATVAR